MKRILLLVILSVGCIHTPAYKLASQENEYWDIWIDHQKECPTNSVATTELCISFATAKRDFGYAADALVRGGSISPQLKRTKKDLKRIKDAVRSPNNSGSNTNK